MDDLYRAALPYRALPGTPEIRSQAARVELPGVAPADWPREEKPPAQRMSLRSRDVIQPNALPVVCLDTLSSWPCSDDRDDTP
ncbi:hypothetical protein VTN96DRAFT_8961 [Rasamsonia emersonii]